MEVLFPKPLLLPPEPPVVEVLFPESLPLPPLTVLFPYPDPLLDVLFPPLNPPLPSEEVLLDAEAPPELESYDPPPPLLDPDSVLLEITMIVSVAEDMISVVCVTNCVV